MENFVVECMVRMCVSGFNHRNYENKKDNKSKLLGLNYYNFNELIKEFTNEFLNDENFIELKQELISFKQSKNNNEEINEDEIYEKENEITIHFIDFFGFSEMYNLHGDSFDVIKNNFLKLIYKI